MSTQALKGLHSIKDPKVDQQYLQWYECLSAHGLIFRLLIAGKVLLISYSCLGHLIHDWAPSCRQSSLRHFKLLLVTLVLLHACGIGGSGGRR